MLWIFSKKDNPMTEQEKLSMYKAACSICLLAENMKTCKLCKFVQPEKIDTVSIIQKEEG